MHPLHDALVGEDYAIVPFRDLPHPYRMALVWYMAVNGETWSDVDFIGDTEKDPGLHKVMALPDGQLLSQADRRILTLEAVRRRHQVIKHRIEDRLDCFDARYGDTLFGMASTPTEAAKASVLRNPEIARDFGGDWQAYHAWYGSLGELPDHGRSDRWPCILSGFDYETFMDGWHRFHSYCRAGDLDIPVVFFPKQRHLRAKNKPACISSPLLNSR